MSEFETVEVFLSGPQKNKFEKNLPFQLSSAQLSASHGKHHVEIKMTKKNHKKLLRNVSMHKGFRFTKANILEGSGIFGKIFKGVAKAVAPTILDTVGDATGTKGLTDALKPSANGLIDLGVKSVTGEGVKGRFVKGSPEAKAFMASIRKKKGGGMIKSNAVFTPKKTTGGKMTKGSPEMAEKMAKLRGMSKGGNVFDDLGKKIRNTFTPDLGRKIKNALTSGTAKQIYKGIADVGIPLVSAATGSPILGAIATAGVDAAIDGSGVKKKRLYRKKNTMTHGTLIAGIPNVILKHDRKRINTNQMGACGGSFQSPTSISGGSFI